MWEIGSLDVDGSGMNFMERDAIRNFWSIFSLTSGMLSARHVWPKAIGCYPLCGTPAPA